MRPYLIDKTNVRLSAKSERCNREPGSWERDEIEDVVKLCCMSSEPKAASTTAEMITIWNKVERCVAKTYADVVAD